MILLAPGIRRGSYEHRLTLVGLGRHAVVAFTEVSFAKAFK